MFHELLVALRGHPGLVFSEKVKVLIFSAFHLKGDGGVGTFDVGGGGCLYFLFKSSNFLGARLISDRKCFNYGFMHIN